MQLRPLGPISNNRFWKFGDAVGGAMVVPFTVPFMIYFRLWHRFAGLEVKALAVLIDL
jgi:hypothetical protein